MQLKAMVQQDTGMVNKYFWVHSTAAYQINDTHILVTHKITTTTQIQQRARPIIK